MEQREQKQILRKRKCRPCLITHILEVLNDDPAIREILLQKLLDNEDLSDDSSSVELARKLRICDPQDTQHPQDFIQKKNKDKRKEPAKVITFGKNKGHYVNKIFMLQVKAKLSRSTIHYHPSNLYYSSIAPKKHCS